MFGSRVAVGNVGDPQDLAKPGFIVRPMKFAEPPAVNPKVASPEELTELLIGELREAHILAARQEAEAAPNPMFLACDVPALRYIERPRYPRSIRYEAQLHCALTDASQAVRWERTLDQRYDELVIFNTMTKLPKKYEMTLYRECVVPLWEGMAYGVQLYLKRPAPPAPSSVTTPLVSPPTTEYAK